MCDYLTKLNRSAERSDCDMFLPTVFKLGQATGFGDVFFLSNFWSF